MYSTNITEEKHKTVILEGGPQALAEPPEKDAKGDEYKADMMRYGMSKTLMVVFITSFSVISQAQRTPIFQSLPSIPEQWEVLAY